MGNFYHSKYSIVFFFTFIIFDYYFFAEHIIYRKKYINYNNDMSGFYFSLFDPFLYLMYTAVGGQRAAALYSNPRICMQ